MQSNTSKNTLLIFAKAPIPGEVKTRLQPHLSPELSADFHRRLVEHCLRVASTVDEVSVELWVGSEHVWWSELARAYCLDIHYQCGDSLGKRMRNAMEHALDESQHAVIVGTDCPFIDKPYIEKAFETLAQSDVVIGPADDGGYVLLGLSQCHEPLFESVDWGTERVLEQTQNKIRRLGLSLTLLNSLMDIDRPDDFDCLRKTHPQLTDEL